MRAKNDPPTEDGVFALDSGSIDYLRENAAAGQCPRHSAAFRFHSAHCTDKTSNGSGV